MPANWTRGYSVLCDRTLHTQSDIDQGRLRVEVSFRPARPVEMIRIVLPIGTTESAPQ